MSYVPDKLTYFHKNKLFWICKRLFDIFISILFIPILIIISCVLLVLNLFFNPGHLFFVQDRMGKDCEVFRVIKFRSMINAGINTRKYDDPVEINRITPLGKIIRKCRIDELPQIINVLIGDMSLIGPRPDDYSHALVYLKNVDGYRDRHIIRPGISGLSQIRLGYAEGLDATSKKVDLDHYYIQNLGFASELKIIFSTILIIFRGLGK